MPPEIGIAIVLRNYSVFSRNVGNVQSDIDRLQGTLGKLTKTSALAGQSLTDFGQMLMGVGRTMSFALTVPIATLTTSLVNAGIQFEDAFAGVSKTVEGVADDFGNLTLLGENVRQEFRQMALDIPIAVDELSRIGQVSGQLGVQAIPAIDGLGTELGRFTEIVAKMGATTDLSTEEAAFAFARLANIMGEQNDIIAFTEGLSNAIVDLGNNVAATEPEIVNAALRIAGAGRVVGLSTQEVLGFGATLAELGVRAEMGGTAVSRILQEMFMAVGEGVQTTEKMVEIQSEEGKLVEKLTNDYNRYQQKILEANIALESGAINQDTYNERTEDAAAKVAELQTSLSYLSPQVQNVAQSVISASGPLVSFATISGQSVEEFQRSFREDAAGATIHFIEQLARLQEEGKITRDMLLEMGLSGIRVRDVLNRMGGDLNIVRDNIELANRAWEEQTALQIEFQKRAITVQSQLQLLKNQFKDLGITIFDLVKDDLLRLINGISDLIQRFKTIDPELQRTILAVSAVAAAIGPLVLVVGTLISLMGGALTAISAFVVTVAGAIGPILLVAGAIAGLGAAIVTFTPLGQPILDFFDNLKKKVEDYLSLGPIPPPTLPEAPPAPTAPVAPYNVPEVRTVSAGERVAGQARELGVDLGPEYQPYEPVDLEALRTQITEAASPDEGAVTSNWQNTLSGIKGKISGFISEVGEIFDKFGTEGLLVRMGFGPHQAGTIGTVIDSFLKAFSTLPASVQEVFKRVKEVVDEQIAGLFEGGALEKITVDWEAVWNTLAEIVTIVITVIGTILSIALGIIFGFISGLAGMFAVLLGQIQVVGAAIGMIIDGVVRVFSHLIEFFKKAVQGDWKGAWDELGQIPAAVLDIFQGIVMGVTGLVIGAFGGLLAFVSGFVTGFLNFFGTLLEGLIGGDGTVVKIVNDVGAWFSKLPTTLSEVQEKIRTKFKEIGDNISADWAELIADITEWWSHLKDEADEKFSAIAGFIGNITSAFNNLKNWLSSKVDDILGPIQRIGNTINWVLGIATDSPELKLQHAFERFENYLNTTQFSMTLGTQLAPQTMSSLSGMTTTGSSVQYVTNDNRIQVGDVNSYNGGRGPEVSLMDTLRMVQAQRYVG